MGRGVLVGRWVAVGSAVGVGTSVGVGVGAGVGVTGWVGPGVAVTTRGAGILSEIIIAIGSTGMAVAAVVGLILDNIIPATPKQRGIRSL